MATNIKHPLMGVFLILESFICWIVDEVQINSQKFQALCRVGRYRALSRETLDCLCLIVVIREVVSCVSVNVFCVVVDCHIGEV